MKETKRTPSQEIKHQSIIYYLSILNNLLLLDTTKEIIEQINNIESLNKNTIYKDIKNKIANCEWLLYLNKYEQDKDKDQERKQKAFEIFQEVKQDIKKEVEKITSNYKIK